MMRLARYILLSSALCAAESFAQEGQLDLSFGMNGIAELSMDTLTFSLSDMVVQSDGRILTTGRCLTEQGWDIYLIRCLPDGGPDATFGSMGSVRTDLGTYWDQAVAVTVQPDGRVIVAAESSENGLLSTVTLVRYMPNGSLDETFGILGIATASPDRFGHPFDLRVKDSGEILVVGSSAYYDEIMLYQFTASGMPDSTFQSDGMMTISPFWSTQLAANVVIQADGKVVLACTYGEPGAFDVAVIRLLADGTYDPTFGNGGTVVLSLTPGDETIGGVGIQSDGSIVIAGTSQFYPNYDMFAARFTTNGVLDPGFGSGGISFVSTSVGSDRTNDLVIQPDDALLLTGRSGQVGGVAAAVAVVRLTPNGVLDPVFGSGGIVRTLIAGASSPAGYAVDLQPDGRIIVAAGGAIRPLLLRYLAGPSIGVNENHGYSLGLVAFPNPIVDIVTISFALEAPGTVSLDVLDAVGKFVLSGSYRPLLPPGSHQTQVDFGQVASGVYTVRLSTSSATGTVRVIKE